MESTVRIKSWTERQQEQAVRREQAIINRKKYRRAYRQQRRVEAPKKPFVAVDGEGGTLDNGYHAYFLLTAGDASIFPAKGNVRLTTRECLTFLSELPRDAIYVSYFFDYDVTKMLEDLPTSKLERLMRRHLRERKDGQGIFPVDYGDWELDYLPRKEFKVRRKGEKSWLVINDVGSFFQCRFVSAIEKWKVGSEANWDEIGRGKESRGSHAVLSADPLVTSPPLSQIHTYNLLECVLLQDLMEKFRDACMDVGYVPKKWQGPGLLAEAMFAAHGVLASRDVPLFSDDRYRDLLRFSQNAFYGGRPEISAVGPVDRPVYQWDINSAYPAAMLDVPCLEHGSWSYVVNPRDWELDDYSLCFGTFSRKKGHRGESQFYGFPMRGKNATISYPASGRGWYWYMEASASVHQDFKVSEAWLYHRACDCKPLGFVADAYQERLALGKDDKGMVLKLALNSLYGKTCQSVGRPKYGNPIWASFITAHCRTQIQRFIHSSPHCVDHTKDGACGYDVVMVATDSVATFTDRTDLVESKELGGWSKETHPDGMFLVQPGLYFGSSGKPAKTRGVPSSAVAGMQEVFRDAYRRMVESRRLEDGIVFVPQQMFVGIRYALHRRNMKLLGQWIEFKEHGNTGKAISFNWTSKRSLGVDDPNDFHAWIMTHPQRGSTETCTVPYAKDIGAVRLRNELNAMHTEAMPDWAAMFVDDDVTGV